MVNCWFITINNLLTKNKVELDIPDFHSVGYNDIKTG